MTRTSVGILRGGTSGEYALSLKTGAMMLSSLPEDKYDTRDIFIDKSGMWYLRGIPTDPARVLAQIDVVLNALHGGIGEDGTVQRILERMGVAYAGSSAHASNLSLNKIRAREAFRKEDIQTPRSVSFTLDNDMNTRDMAQEVFSQFGPPYIVKPPSDGAGRGVRFVAMIVELSEQIADVLDEFGGALVEEFVDGEESTVGVIENFRGDELYVLPPAHIEVPEGHRHIVYDHHEEGLLRHNVPSNFSHSEKQALAEIARAAHRALGLSHFSRADIILSSRGPYLLEVNAYPGLYQGAAFPPMLESVGSSTREFLEHAIALARS